MAGQLEGRVALLAGGSSGIGRATAMAFARERAKVVLADVDVEGGEETVHMIEEAGGHAIFVQTDISKGDEVGQIVNNGVETYGRLDCAFNNAGIGGEGGTVECTEQDWDRRIVINFKGVWLCMEYEIPQLLKQGSGLIVNMSSAAGLVRLSGSSAYVASEHGSLASVSWLHWSTLNRASESMLYAQGQPTRHSSSRDLMRLSGETAWWVSIGSAGWEPLRRSQRRWYGSARMPLHLSQDTQWPWTADTSFHST